MPVPVRLILLGRHLAVPVHSPDRLGLLLSSFDIFFNVRPAVLKHHFRTIDQSYLAENLSIQSSPGKARDNCHPRTPGLLIYPR